MTIWQPPPYGPYLGPQPLRPPPSWPRQTSPSGPATAPFPSRESLWVLSIPEGNTDFNSSTYILPCLFVASSSFLACCLRAAAASRSMAATGVDVANGRSGTRRRNDTAADETKSAVTAETRASSHPTYRHVSAVHSTSRPSCLSHDSDAAPSFIGFRNLMVIVLGKTDYVPSFAIAYSI